MNGTTTIDIDDTHVVVIKKGLGNVPESLFQGRLDLTHVRFEEGFTGESIGAYAFSGTSVEYIYIPKSIVHIGFGAFFGSDKLQRVEFASGLVLDRLDDFAFADCPHLQQFCLPPTTSVGKYIFANDGKLHTLEIQPPFTMLHLDTDTFTYLPNLARIILRASTTAEIDHAHGLRTTLLLPTGRLVDSDVDVRIYNVDQSVSSRSIQDTPPSLSTTINSMEIFHDTSHCSKVRRVYNTVHDLPRYLLLTRSMVSTTDPELVCPYENIMVGHEVVHLGDAAFHQWKTLQHVTFSPNGILQHIGDYTFHNTTLSTLTIPDSLESIGFSAFFQNRTLSILSTTPDTSRLTTLGALCFAECGLTHVQLPQSIRDVGHNAFGSNLHLEQITFTMHDVRQITFHGALATNVPKLGRIALVSTSVDLQDQLIHLYIHARIDLTTVDVVVGGVQIPRSVVDDAIYAALINESIQANLTGIIDPEQRDVLQSVFHSTLNTTVTKVPLSPTTVSDTIHIATTMVTEFLKAEETTFQVGASTATATAFIAQQVHDSGEGSFITDPQSVDISLIALSIYSDVPVPVDSINTSLTSTVDAVLHFAEGPVTNTTTVVQRLYTVTNTPSPIADVLAQVPSLLNISMVPTGTQKIVVDDDTTTTAELVRHLHSGVELARNMPGTGTYSPISNVSNGVFIREHSQFLQGRVLGYYLSTNTSGGYHIIVITPTEKYTSIHVAAGTDRYLLEHRAIGGLQTLFVFGSSLVLPTQCVSVGGGDPYINPVVGPLVKLMNCCGTYRLYQDTDLVVNATVGPSSVRAQSDILQLCTELMEIGLEPISTEAYFFTHFRFCSTQSCTHWIEVHLDTMRVIISPALQSVRNNVRVGTVRSQRIYLPFDERCLTSCHTQHRRYLVQDIFWGVVQFQILYSSNPQVRNGIRLLHPGYGPTWDGLLAYNYRPKLFLVRDRHSNTMVVNKKKRRQRYLCQKNVHETVVYISNN